MANQLAPDGWRYGVRFNDGSVLECWNGRTQRQRAEEFMRAVVAEQLASVGRHDTLTLVRRRAGQGWQSAIGSAPKAP